MEIFLDQFWIRIYYNCGHPKIHNERLIDLSMDYISRVTTDCLTEMEVTYNQEYFQISHVHGYYFLLLK